MIGNVFLLFHHPPVRLKFYYSFSFVIIVHMVEFVVRNYKLLLLSLMIAEAAFALQNRLFVMFVQNLLHCKVLQS